MAPSRIDDYPETETPSRLFNELGWQVENERGYRILERPLGSVDRLRIIHVGAGAAGICFTKFSQDMLTNVDIQLYDKNHDVGGTWLENRYPGCACDIPSACYQFSWARNPNWTQYYSGSKEIWEYFRDVAEKYNVKRYAKFNHTVVAADWKHDEGLWHVKVKEPDGKEFTDTCNVLINGTGVLNKWKWPDIKDLHSFKGILQHSANYDENIKLDGKRVAVFGMGSSGIQIVSNVEPKVEKLYTWIRSPTWITAGFGQRFAGQDGANFSYTAEQKKSFQDNPELFLKYSKMIESELNQRFKFILKKTTEAQSAVDYAVQEMKQKLQGHDDLQDAIIPKDFGVGCRRPTPGNGFLEALMSPKTHVFTKEIQRVTPKGFIDDKGEEHEVDVIICATGFDTTHIPRFSLTANGTSIAEMWKKEPSPYLSVAAAHMPNYFIMCGPYGPLGHGSILPITEILIKYIFQCVKKMQVCRIKSLTPKTEMVEAFKEHADLFLKRTAWTDNCRSWFKRGRLDGPLAMYPGSRLAFLELLSSPRFEDYDIEYRNPLNPLEFLGNGFAMREFDGRDLSAYLGLIDGRDVQVDLEADLSHDLQALVPTLGN